MRVRRLQGDGAQRTQSKAICRWGARLLPAIAMSAASGKSAGEGASAALNVCQTVDSQPGTTGGSVRRLWLRQELLQRVEGKTRCQRDSVKLALVWEWKTAYAKA